MFWELNRPVWQMHSPVKRVLRGERAEQPSSWSGCGLRVLGTSCRAHLHLWLCNIPARLHQNTDRSAWVPRGCWITCLPYTVIWMWEHTCNISYTDAAPNQNMCIKVTFQGIDTFFLCKQICSLQVFHQVLRELGGAVCWLLGMLADSAHESSRENLRRTAKLRSRTPRRGDFQQKG